MDYVWLRPVASVINEAMGKVDWLVRKILRQLIPFVPANLSNSVELVEIFKKLDKSHLNDDDSPYQTHDDPNGKLWVSIFLADMSLFL